LASAAGSISFWFPTFTFFNINLSSFGQNIIGAVIASVVSSFQQIQFQYPQTYLMYVFW
jgi:hypothetical protein